MTLRVSDWQPESDLDSIRNSCDVLQSVGHLNPFHNIVLPARQECWNRRDCSVLFSLHSPRIETSCEENCMCDTIREVGRTDTFPNLHLLDLPVCVGLSYFPPNNRLLNFLSNSFGPAMILPLLWREPVW